MTPSKAFGLLVVCALGLARGAHPADEIHWTLKGQTAVTFDWRGADSILSYGPTSSYGQSVTAVSQAGTMCDPAAVPL